MAFEFQILWTDEAISNLDDIIDYLNDKWTEREIIHFKKKLSRQISLIE
jgi:plasmid stabilization system protein ParE